MTETLIDVAGGQRALVFAEEGSIVGQDLPLYVDIVWVRRGSPRPSVEYGTSELVTALHRIADLVESEITKEANGA